jgi:hypothetical protein
MSSPGSSADASAPCTPSTSFTRLFEAGMSTRAGKRKR